MEAAKRRLKGAKRSKFGDNGWNVAGERFGQTHNLRSQQHDSKRNRARKEGRGCARGCARVCRLNP